MDWIKSLVRKFKDAKVQADQVRDSNSATIRNLVECAERECDTTQAAALADALDSVSVNLTMRLKGDTDKAKKEGVK